MITAYTMVNVTGYVGFFCVICARFTCPNIDGRRLANHFGIVFSCLSQTAVT